MGLATILKQLWVCSHDIFSILKLQTFAISYEIAIYGELGRAHFEG